MEPNQKPSPFLTIHSDFSSQYFIGPAPKEGDVIEYVCVGVKDGHIQIQLRVRPSFDPVFNTGSTNRG